MEITPAQIRAARALLGLTPEQVAARAQVPVAALRALEEAGTLASGATGDVASVQTALEEAGAEFIPDGVRHSRFVSPEAEARYHAIMRIGKESAAVLAGRDDLLTDADLYDESGLPA